jgi:two-component system, NtrC family, sensor kinase
VLTDPEYNWHEGQKISGQRVVFAAPLLRDGNCIGVMTMTRSVPKPFTTKQIELVTTFADQAVIAIENVRLFDEVQARTRELSESLEQQTATSEILRVISSSLTDAQPVFDAIVQSGRNLFPDATIAIALRDGDQVRAAAIAERDPQRVAAWRGRFPVPLGRDYMHGTAILDRRVIDIPDAEAYGAGPLALGVKNFLASGYRATTIMPMVRGDAAIGAIGVNRLAPGPLSPKQIDLLRTFADQAVIAIENVRLFDAVQARTRELSQSVEELRALGEVSQAVNSTLDTDKVLTTIVVKAVELSGTEQARSTRLTTHARNSGCAQPTEWTKRWWRPSGIDASVLVRRTPHQNTPRTRAILRTRTGAIAHLSLCAVRVRGVFWCGVGV